MLFSPGNRLFGVSILQLLVVIAVAADSPTV